MYLTEIVYALFHPSLRVSVHFHEPLYGSRFRANFSTRPHPSAKAVFLTNRELTAFEAKPGKEKRCSSEAAGIKTSLKSEAAKC